MGNLSARSTNSLPFLANVKNAVVDRSSYFDAVDRDPPYLYNQNQLVSWLGLGLIEVVLDICKYTASKAPDFLQKMAEDFDFIDRIILEAYCKFRENFALMKELRSLHYRDLRTTIQVDSREIEIPDSMGKEIALEKLCGLFPKNDHNLCEFFEALKQYQQVCALLKSTENTLIRTANPAPSGGFMFYGVKVERVSNNHTWEAVEKLLRYLRKAKIIDSVISNDIDVSKAFLDWSAKLFNQQNQ